MPPHPPEIPEILIRIGSFLPLWNNDVLIAQSQDQRFDPKTLLVCVSVSRLWRQNLLPVLWYRYDCAHMHAIPQDIVALYSPHFQVMKVFEEDNTPFQCADLIRLTIERKTLNTAGDGAGTGTGLMKGDAECNDG
ncbi:hypothetical protein BGX33_002387 [Mortierella sp. NVP41]|nr:hypothetical protein BGX33_002387 [Mortierella sp. NVP41]